MAYLREGMQRIQRKHRPPSDFDISIVPYSETPVKNVEKNMRETSKHARNRGLETEEPQIIPLGISLKKEKLQKRHSPYLTSDSDHSGRNSSVANGYITDARSTPQSNIAIDSVTAYQYSSGAGRTKTPSKLSSVFSMCFSCRCINR